MYFRVILSVFSLLMYAGIAQAAPFAYIANNASHTVSVLDTASNKVTAVLPVGQNPYGVAVNRMGSRVYVSSQTDNAISVIDTFDNSLSTISLALQPGALAVNSAGTRLFVANPSNNSVSVINTVDKSLISTVSMPSSPNCQPQGIVTGPVDGSGNYNVYVSCNGRASVAVINANDSGSYVKSATEAKVDPGPMGIAVSADGKKVFVACNNYSKLNVINAQDLTETQASISVGTMPWGVAVDPSVADSTNSTRVYVTNSGSDSISVVDAAGAGVGTLSLGTNISLPNGAPMGISFTADGAKAVAADYNLNKVSVVLKSDNSVTSTDGDSGAGTTPPNMKIGTYPMSLGNFAGPDFVTIDTSVNDSNCGKIDTPEMITSKYLGGNDYLYQVAKGQNVKFNITANTNCAISNVAVDSASVGQPTSYSFAVPVANHNLFATFTRTAYRIDVSSTGTGSGKIVSKLSNVLDGGIDCGATCSHSYPVGSVLTLTAVENPGSTFEGWQGHCSNISLGATCSFTVTDSNASQIGIYDGLFVASARFRLSSGPVRTGRPSAIKTSQIFSSAFDSIAAGSTVNPIDLDTSKEYVFSDTGVFGVSGKSTAITLVGGWTNYSTAPYGDLPAGSASIIKHADTFGNPLPTVIAYGSLTIGSYNMGDGINHGAIIIK